MILPCRRERRLFDLVDINHTGYVTLDEIISFRERNDARAEMDLHKMDIPLLNMQPDLTRSLVALYHFDVRLDGHLTFHEFILLQDYLRKVELQDEDEVMCWCFPKKWFRRRRLKRKHRTEDEDLSSLTPSRHLAERLLSRKVSSQPSPWAHPLPHLALPPPSLFNESHLEQHVLISYLPVCMLHKHAQQALHLVLWTGCCLSQIFDPLSLIATVRSACSCRAS